MVVSPGMGTVAIGEAAPMVVSTMAEARVDGGTSLGGVGSWAGGFPVASQEGT